MKLALHTRRITRTAAAVMLSLTSLLTINIGSASAAALTCDWTGASGTDLKFSTAANWANCTGASNPAGVPVAGDIIQFDPVSPASQKFNLVNDLGTVALGGVVFNNGTSANYTSYNVDTLTLVDGATATDVGTTTPVTLRAATLIGQGSLSVSGYGLSFATLTVTGALSLSNNANAFIATGSSVGGAVNVGDTASLDLYGGTVGSVAIAKGGYVNVSAQSASQTFSTPLTFGGGSGTNNPVVYFNNYYDSVTYKPIDTTWTVDSAVVLQSDAYISDGGQTTVNFTGTIAGATYKLTNDPSMTGYLNLNPTTNTSLSTTGAQENAPTTVTIADGVDKTADNTIGQVNPFETLIVDGKANNVFLNRNATLMGGGTIMGLYAATLSVVAPGHSPGCITSSGDIAIFGTYKVDVAGTTPCSGYDQLVVTGTVTLSDANNGTGTLEATPYGGYIPKVGEAYTIISNDGTDAVIGTFNGLAEGATYTNQGVTYSVTYKGGDGNDVVLTVTKVDAAALPGAVATPKTPNTGLKLAAAHPMVSLATTMIAAGLLFGASRRMKPATRRR